MQDFSPLTALGGGALIGAAAVLLLLLNGRIAGISGIVNRAILTPDGDGRRWRLAFLFGLIAAPLIWHAATGAQPVIEIAAPLATLAAAGGLVGLGTAIGGGCTSGHGICGLARVSPRSLWATITFIAVAMVTVFVVRHLIGG
jgi:uncharacterized membrane protein YedE/YeeE